MTENGTQVLWRPDKEFIEQSRLTAFTRWLEERRELKFDSYNALWQWSIEHLAEFWLAIWEYFELESETQFKNIISKDPMPDTHWFLNASLNYAEHVFNQYTKEHPAIVFASERHFAREIPWREMRDTVSRLRSYLKSLGVEKGDRVVAYLPNIPEATYAFLATISLGAVWSSCSPDFGVNSVVDRFSQIEPKVMFAVDGYQYNGKPYDKTEAVNQIMEQVPSVDKLIVIPYLQENVSKKDFQDAVLWENALTIGSEPLEFEEVPFEHPIWILYSSGTTGKPKAITHSHGGMLLEHVKYLALHNDVQPGERFFWYSTTGWMMWNFVQASFLVGSTIVLYDGSPGYPDLNVLWKLAADTGINHFGTSAPFLVACMKQQLEPNKTYDLSKMRSIGSTGAPLPPEAFDWVYEHIHDRVWLCSMSGGTDVCTAFVGGCPWLPVYRGEIQCRGLGVSLFAFNEEGEKVVNEVGEMVITESMPSMPIYFWNDPDKKRYMESYFGVFPKVWRHGDWVKVTDRGTVIILGRSDATLNRLGVRIGTAEIYRALNGIEEIEDAIIVNLELDGGKHYMPLFLKIRTGNILDDDLKKQIRQTLKSECSPRHVPDEIIEAPDIPYTISGKKMEAPLKKILLGMKQSKVLNKDSMRKPEAMEFYRKFAGNLASRI